MPELTIDSVYKLAVILTAFGSAGLGWLLLRMRAEFARIADVKAVEARLDALDREIADLRAGQRDAPNNADVHRLELQLEKLAGQFGVVVERLEGLDRIVARAERVVERQETYLLRNGVGS